MDNILDFVKWRGDIPFDKQLPGVVDGIVFAELSYWKHPDMTYADRMTIREAREKEKAPAPAENASADAVEMASLEEAVPEAAAAETKDPDEAMPASAPTEAAATEAPTETTAPAEPAPAADSAAVMDSPDFEPLLDAMAASERYGNLTLCNYEDITDDEANVQFSAVTVETRPGECVIAFRGTDDSLVGWKEDFMLSFTEIPAQKLALAYVRKVLPFYDAVVLTGHSKGANLALYAAAMLDDNELARVKHVYLNDGPGFCEDVFDLSRLSLIHDRTTRVLPEGSVIGRIFETSDLPTVVVKSSAAGVMQHDPLTWSVTPDGLEEVEKTSVSSDRVAGILDGWLKSGSMEARESFVTTLFNAMGEGNVTTLSAFSKKGPAAFENVVVRLMTADEETKTFVKELPKTALHLNWLEQLRNSTPVVTVKKSELIQGLIIIALAALAFVFSENIIPAVVAITLAALIIYELVLTILHLQADRWDFSKQKIRVSVCLALIAVYMVLIFKENALYVVASSIFGSLFLVVGYNYLVWLPELKAQSRKVFGFFYLLFALMWMGTGLFVLMGPEKGIWWYTRTAGTLLFISGSFKVINSISAKFMEKKTVEAKYGASAEGEVRDEAAAGESESTSKDAEDNMAS